MRHPVGRRLQLRCRSYLTCFGATFGPNAGGRLGISAVFKIRRDMRLLNSTFWFFAWCVVGMGSPAAFGNEPSTRVNCTGEVCFGPYLTIAHKFSDRAFAAMKTMLKEQCNVHVVRVAEGKEAAYHALQSALPLLVIFSSTAELEDTNDLIKDSARAAVGYSETRIELKGGHNWLNPVTGQNTKEFWVINQGFNQCGSVNCFVSEVMSISTAYTGVRCNPE